MGVPDKETFLLSTSLYEKFKFEVTDLESIVYIVFNSKSIDSHCIQCKKSSTFLPFPPNKTRYPLTTIERKIKGKQSIIDSDGPSLSDLYKELIGEQFFISQIYRCSRNENHRMHFNLMIDGHKIMKIGQFPSLADLNQVNIAKYRGILESEKYAELNKGLGLISHGIGIGSFVYLRRIFEHLIQDASKKAAHSLESWDESTFASKKMDEKIKILRRFLPEFLVENKNIYGILSKGIHELSEDDCKEIFPHVQLAVELILDEKLAEKEKEKKIRTAKLSLNKIGERLSK